MLSDIHRCSLDVRKTLIYFIIIIQTSIEPDVFFHRQSAAADEDDFEHATDSCVSCFASCPDIRLCSLSSPLMSRVKNNKRPSTVSLAKWITHTSHRRESVFLSSKEYKIPTTADKHRWPQPNFSNTVNENLSPL